MHRQKLNPIKAWRRYQPKRILKNSFRLIYLKLDETLLFLFLQLIFDFLVD